jgi:hypothetical protein
MTSSTFDNHCRIEPPLRSLEVNVAYQQDVFGLFDDRTPLLGLATLQEKIVVRDLPRHETTLGVHLLHEVLRRPVGNAAGSPNPRLHFRCSGM